MFEFFDTIDKRLLCLINQSWSSEWLDTLMILASEKWAWLPLYLIIIAYFIKKFKKKSLPLILAILLAVGLADGLSSKLLKPLTKRDRPCNVEELHVRTPDGCSHSFGFVSSHAANHAAIAAMAIWILGLSGVSKFAMILWATLVAYSRVYLGKHYPFDVFFGALLGVLIACCVVYLLRRYRFLRIDY